MTTVSTPTTTNNAAQMGDTVVNGLIKGGLSAGEALLFADYPFLAVPGVKQIFEGLFNFLAGYAVRGLSEFVTFTIIDIQVGHEISDFKKALGALKAAQASHDPAAIAAALADFQVAAQNLGHSDGSATPQ